MDDKCTHAFSSGTEFDIFMERCISGCTRYRNGKCRILNACMDARFDRDRFPYDDLRSGTAITCRHYTEEKRARNRKQIDGQMALF